MKISDQFYLTEVRVTKYSTCFDSQGVNESPQSSDGNNNAQLDKSSL